MGDVVNHPDHYTEGGIETIDFITAKKLDYELGNVIKYVSRAPYKGKYVEDLKKARWYLDHKIQEIEEEAAQVKALEAINIVAQSFDPEATVPGAHVKYSGKPPHMGSYVSGPTVGDLKALGLWKDDEKGEEKDAVQD